MRILLPALMAMMAMGCGGLDGEILAVGSTPMANSVKKDEAGNFISYNPDRKISEQWKDKRGILVRCPACKTRIDVGSEYCPKTAECGEYLVWKKEYPCLWCAGTGKCRACVSMGQDKGKCYNCEGGRVSYLGRTSPCPNCEGTAHCILSKGTDDCDMCGGSGKLSHSQLKELTIPENEK